MAKYTIKGNNWKSQGEQKRQLLINRLLPVLCVAFALICIASSIMLRQSEENGGDTSAVGSAITTEEMQDIEKTGSVKETDAAKEIRIVEETRIDEENDSAEKADAVEETDRTEEAAVGEEVYIAQETHVSADTYSGKKTDDIEKNEDAGKTDGGEKTDSTEDTGEEEVKAEVSSYDIINGVENTELVGKVTVNESAAYTATLKAADGYMLPKSISVIMGEDETAVENVSYNPETGKIRIPAGTIKGDLTITGSAELILYYSVTSKISNSILYGTTADTQNGYSATIVPNAGYSLPTAVTATVGDAAFTDFTYNAVTGKITVEPSAMMGDLTFAGECAAAIRAEKYQITASVGHGKAEIRNDSTASAMKVVIVPDAGYACPEELIVISGGKRFTDFTYDDQSGMLMIGYGKVSRVIISGVCINKETSIKYLGGQSAIPKSWENQNQGMSGEIVSRFLDVGESDYFYDPVVWATQQGIATGVDTLHFAPYASVTRGQVVTFLWRAAGCPEPKGNAGKFTDVPQNEYYAKSVAWAIEQGITTGTTDTTFCPEDVCTRGQIITFLARFAGAKDAGTKSTFSDVKPTEFFAAAVKWAEDNGIVESTTSKTFAPYANCNRADVVTFLYRWMVK